MNPPTGRSGGRSGGRNRSGRPGRIWCSPHWRRCARARRRPPETANVDTGADRCAAEKPDVSTTMPAACAPGQAASKAATTSAPTSKQQGPMQGPSATRRSSGRQPNPSAALHAGHRDARHGPAPTRMQRRARPGPWISDQDRHAVSHVHRQAKARWLLQQSVGFHALHGLGIVAGRRTHHMRPCFCETRNIARAPEAAKRRRRFSATFSGESPHLLPKLRL